MAGEDSATAQRIRYEPDEKAPQGLAAATAAQTVLLIIVGIMLTPLVIALILLFGKGVVRLWARGSAISS